MILFTELLPNWGKTLYRTGLLHVERLLRCLYLTFLTVFNVYRLNS